VIKEKVKMEKMLITGVAADTFFFIVDQWCGTARNHFNFHLTHLASPPI
jgi:hypothetical protein